MSAKKKLSSAKKSSSTSWTGMQTSTTLLFKCWPTKRVSETSLSVRIITSHFSLAQDVIEQKQGKFFSTKNCSEKLGILETSFKTFGWMLKLPGVAYNPTTNIASASDAVWSKILKEHTFVFAYRTYGDTEWEELSTIFATLVTYHIGNTSNNDIIILSSEDEEDRVDVVPSQPIRNPVQ